MDDLSARFENDMIEIVYRTTGRETGYWASYFLRTVKRYGGVGAARRLLETKGVSKGLLTLREKDRLDLAMEAIVLRPEYASLFTPEERAIAAARLDRMREWQTPLDATRMRECETPLDATVVAPSAPRART
jgi:hypothetical protein